MDVSESHILNLIRLKAAKKNIHLWRNNVGATYTQRGDFIRYGLANDSKQINDKIKSSDLIGIKPVIITEDMIGDLIGQFICREVKHSGWKFTGTPREIAQLNWIELILSLGGDAAFATSENNI
jgi:hypothetical protein